MPELRGYRRSVIVAIAILLSMLFLASAFAAAFVFTSSRAFAQCALDGCGPATVIGLALLAWLASAPALLAALALSALGFDRVTQHVERVFKLRADQALPDSPAALSRVIKQLTHDIAVERQARAEADARADYALSHDALTGLVNRTRAAQLIGDAIAKSGKDETGVAVYFLDFDDFKYINDTYGHAAGDQFLRLIGDRLRRALDCDDCVARVGGDEFLVLSEGVADAAHAGSIADALLAEVAKPCLINGVEVRVTTSIGVALHPVHGADAQSLINCADRAMYAAKQKGRNVFEVWRG